MARGANGRFTGGGGNSPALSGSVNVNTLVIALVVVAVLVVAVRFVQAIADLKRTKPGGTGVDTGSGTSSWSWSDVAGFLFVGPSYLATK